MVELAPRLRDQPRQQSALGRARSAAARTSRQASPAPPKARWWRAANLVIS
jgi:hypothetical protein